MRGFAPNGVYDIEKGMLKVCGGCVIMNMLSPVNLTQINQFGIVLKELAACGVGKVVFSFHRDKHPI